MKAISIKQPWASLVCSGIKDIENRTWECPKKYIGTRVLIHSSLTPAVDKWRSLNQEQIREACRNGLTGAEFYKLPLGAIIGSVKIVACVQNHPSIWAEKGVWNWVLANPILFESPIENVKGKLSFWDYEF